MSTSIVRKRTDDLPGYAVRLSPNEAIEELTYIARGQSPLEALEAAIAWRDVITPRLLEELALAPVDVAAREAASTQGHTYFLHTVSFYLLGLFREPRAFPLMLDYFASDGDLAEELSGEVLSGYLPSMLVRCYDGSNRRRLQLMIETDAFDPIFRHNCLQAYQGLVLSGAIEKSEVVAYAGSLLDAIPADAGFNRWYPWLALAAAELQAPELRARIEALFDRGLTSDPVTVLFDIASKTDIAAIYADRPERIAAGILADSFFDNLAERISRWPWFQKVEERDRAARTLTGVQHDLPYVRNLPKVGRNDACLCGSGKKYKKCCLH